MWQINTDTTVQIDELMGSKIYTIDNVFKYPKKLERFLFNRKSFPLQGEPWSANMDNYIKQRYSDWVDNSCPIVAIAQYLCKQSLGNHGGFSTNVEAWYGGPNAFDKYYWWPHLDDGYTLIVYFNHEHEHGTNLYHPDLKEKAWFKRLMTDTPLGKDPWISKKDVCLLYTSPSPRDATLSRMPSSA